MQIFLSLIFSDYNATEPESPRIKYSKDVSAMFIRSAVSYRYYRDLPHREPHTEAVATRRLPPKLGQRRSLAEHPFPGISRLSTRKLQAKYTHTAETVRRVKAGGRKEGRKEETKAGRGIARCRRSSCGYAVNHDEVP